MAIVSAACNDGDLDACEALIDHEQAQAEAAPDRRARQGAALMALGKGRSEMSHGSVGGVGFEFSGPPAGDVPLDGRMHQLSLMQGQSVLPPDPRTTRRASQNIWRKKRRCD